MRKAQFENVDEIRIDIDKLVINDTISNIQNKYKIKSSYNINKSNNSEKAAILKVKINPNYPSEFTLVNSNFHLNYLSISNDSIENITTFNREHTERINDICYIKNSNATFDKSIISASSDGNIKIWESRSSDSILNLSLNKNIFSVDSDSNLLAAGTDKEILIWDLRTMKQMYKCKFAHSDDILSVKLKNNILISGGEDCIVNILDIENGLTMDSVVSTVSLTQPVANVDFLDEELNSLMVSTTVHSFHIINIQSGTSLYEFDSKSEVYNTKYIIDSYFNKEKKVIELFCGNHNGDLTFFDISLKNKAPELSLNATFSSDFIQSFNSLDKVPHNDDYIVASDQGIIYLMAK